MKCLFYTNAFIYKNDIYYTGYENEKRVKRKIRYKPYLFWHSAIHPNNESWKTLEGLPVSQKSFKSIFDANRWIREMKPIENFNFYGNTNFLYVWINDTFTKQIKYDSSLINIIHIDIEVESDKGLPNYRNPIHPITAITIAKHGKKITFGCKEYTPKSPDVAYVHCKDEVDLLKKFLAIWSSPKYNPDVLTGWNIEMFDIPYLYNRIRHVLNEEQANRLSPWGIVEVREIAYKFKEVSDLIYDLKGISTLDYLSLYRKFSFKNQESYSLNFIANEELGEKKLDYSEYESLLHLYNEDYEKFIDYNIRDVELVEKLDDKLKLIEQVFALAYDAKVTYADTLTTLKMWDTLIHNYLLDQDIVVPQPKQNQDAELIGAYVKDPQIGMHKWVVSFDLTSLYPHLIMQYNISPETFLKKVRTPYSIEEVIDGVVNGNIHNFITPEDWQLYSISANLCCYERDRQGFLPALMEKVYQDRANYKKQMIEAKKEFEKTKKPELKKVIAQFDYLQMAKKIQMNSGYGALANPYFRFFDHDNAEAITSSGQLTIRWVADRLNVYLNRVCANDKDYIIAIDTDSVYVDLEDLVFKVGLINASPEKIISFLDKSCKTQILPFIESCYQEMADYTNAYKNCMQMKREVIASKGIWSAKKRYILNVWDSEGVRYLQPQIKVQGIESVRSSTPSSCRANIKKCLSIIMNENEEALLKFIEKFREEFKTLPVDEIAFPRSINGLDKYRDAATIFAKHTPIQVKGALIYNHLISQNKLDATYPYIYNGDKIKYVYLKVPNPLQQTTIAFINAVPKQFGITNYIDYDTQFEKGFLAPVRTIVDAIGWQLEHKASLEEFFV